MNNRLIPVSGSGSARKGMGLLFAALFLLSVVPAAPARAQELQDREEVTIYFRFDDATLYPDYMTNRESFARLDSILHARTYADIDAVLVISKSSPEGVFSYNQRLSERRARSMSNYLQEHYPLYMGKVTIVADDESWGEFRASILADTEIADGTRTRMLDIVDSDIHPDRKEALLKSLPSWRYFYKKYFPEFRFSAITLVFVRYEDFVIADEPFYVPIEEIAMLEDDLTVPMLRSKRMIAALKTNLLFDAATALNAEIEIPIADRWSVMIEDVFPWWETGNKYCLQMWEMGLEARYWFKPWDPRGVDKLRGWFAGLYGMSSKYDFQNDKKVNYQGEYWSAGLTGGYSLPLGRKKWGNLELSLGLGYLDTQFRHYQPNEAYSKLIHDRFNDGNAHYFGPTKAKISLVIPINVYNPVTKKEVRHE